MVDRKRVNESSSSKEEPGQNEQNKNNDETSDIKDGYQARPNSRASDNDQPEENMQEESGDQPQAPADVISSPVEEQREVAEDYTSTETYSASFGIRMRQYYQLMTMSPEQAPEEKSTMTGRCQLQREFLIAMYIIITDHLSQEIRESMTSNFIRAAYLHSLPRYSVRDYNFTSNHILAYVSYILQTFRFILSNDGYEVELNIVFDPEAASTMELAAAMEGGTSSIRTIWVDTCLMLRCAILLVTCLVVATYVFL